MSNENSGAPGRHSRRLRNLLVDRRFQLKYAAIIALIGGLIFGIMAWLFFDQVRENAELTALDVAVASANSSASAAVGADDITAEINARMDREVAAIRWTLAAFWLILMFALFIVGLFATHRIAGPIRVVDGYLENILQHESITPRRLRRGDEFKGLFRRANAVVAMVQDERKLDAQTLRNSVQSVRAGVREVGGMTMGGWLDEALAPLEALAQRKEDGPAQK